MATREGTHTRNGSARAADTLFLTAEVIGQDAAAMLVLVAVRAEVLPIAAVGRIVVVVAVFVVHREQMQVGLIELARALCANPSVDLQRPGAIALQAGLGHRARLAYEALCIHTFRRRAVPPSRPKTTRHVNQV